MLQSTIAFNLCSLHHFLVVYLCKTHGAVALVVGHLGAGGDEDGGVVELGEGGGDGQSEYILQHPLKTDRP